MKSAAEKTERVIIGQINSFERELELAGARLEKQLAKAEQLRQRGLKEENTRILQQAEQYERKAMQEYERSIANFNRRSVQLERHTKSRAGAQIIMASRVIVSGRRIATCVPEHSRPGARLELTLPRAQ